MPKPGRGEVLVALRAAALNHRDLFITQGKYAGIQFPSILGSDGAGELDGRRVILNPSLNWGKNRLAQGRDFQVLGMPTSGTFAEFIKISRRQIFPAPAHLSDAQAAALPLAGLTAWRTLFTRCQLKKGEKVLVSGVGGGVALMTLQLAVAAGAEVWATSGTTEKIERAIQLGAKGGSNYREADWDKFLKKEAGGFDVIIDSAGGDQFPALVGLCNPGARVGVFGGTLGKIKDLSPQIIFWKQLSILGSTMGNEADFRRMLAFVERHQIVPVVDSTFALAAGNQALARMDAGKQFGKITLSI